VRAVTIRNSCKLGVPSCNIGQLLSVCVPVMHMSHWLRSICEPSLMSVLSQAGCLFGVSGMAAVGVSRESHLAASWRSSAVAGQRTGAPTPCHMYGRGLVDHHANAWSSQEHAAGTRVPAIHRSGREPRVSLLVCEQCRFGCIFYVVALSRSAPGIADFCSMQGDVLGSEAISACKPA